MTSPKHQLLTLHAQHFNLVDPMQPQFHISKSEFGFPLSTISVTILCPLISHVQNLRNHHLLIRILYLLYVFLECLPRFSFIPLPFH